MSDRTCNAPECTRPHHSGGLCGVHAKRLKRTGSLELPTVADRFRSHLVELPSGCIEWNANRSPEGYGKVRVRGRDVRAHRFAWELANGPIPDGMIVLHRCDNPPCCNPDHLSLGTLSDNTRDMVAKRRQLHSRKTHCVNGHEFTAANTYSPPGTERRMCRTCARINDAKRRERKVN